MRDGPRRFRPDSSCPAVLRSASPDPPLPVRGCHPLWPDFPVRSGSFRSPYDASYYPGCASTRPVWALPPSLAATEGIDVSFSSCRYLDVSVPCVRPGHASGGGHSARRVSPFGHARITSCLRIPAPLRSLPRPSSPPEAQASPVRSCNLLSLSESYIRFRVCLEIAVPLFLAELLVFSFFAFTSLSFPILSMISARLSRLPPPYAVKASKAQQHHLYRRSSQDSVRLVHQKGGVPATPSGTATLLRLSPSHQYCPRPVLAVPDFRHPRLPWLDGRCVQGPGTYSPRHG